MYINYYIAIFMMFYKPSFSLRFLLASAFFLLDSLPAVAEDGLGCFELRDTLAPAGFEFDTTPEVVSLTPPSTLFFNCHVMSSTDKNFRRRS